MEVRLNNVHKYTTCLSSEYRLPNAEGSIVITSGSLSILEGNMDSVCVELIAEQGNPNMLVDDLIIPLSVNLSGKAGRQLISNLSVVFMKENYYMQLYCNSC